MIDTTTCPECCAAAVVEWRAVLESTDGPIEHAKIRCVQGHWFLLPLAMLAHHRVDQPHRELVTARSGPT